MITVIVSTQALAGKSADVVAFAKQVADLSAQIAPAYPRLKVGTTPFGGGFGKVFWIVEIETMAQYEEMMALLTASPDYAQLLQKAGSLVVTGSTYTEVIRHV